MDSFTNFLMKGADFYLSAPIFFNSAAPIAVAAFGGLIYLAYWLGCKFSQAENDGLKAQIAALDQRLNLAKEESAVAVKEADGLKVQVEKLEGQISSKAPTAEIQASAVLLRGNVNRLVSANNAVADLVSVGFDEKGQLKWREIYQIKNHSNRNDPKS